jgi:hypothetical protein
MSSFAAGGENGVDVIANPVGGFPFLYNLSTSRVDDRGRLAQGGLRNL